MLNRLIIRTRDALVRYILRRWHTRRAYIATYLLDATHAVMRARRIDLDVEYVDEGWHS